MGAEGTNERLKLIGLDVGAATERGLDGSVIGARDGSPTESINERGQPVGVVKLVGVDMHRQSARGVETAPRLQLPDHAELVPKPVFFDALQGDGVLQRLNSIIRAAASNALLLDVCHHPVPSPDGNDLAYVWHLDVGNRAVRNDGV